MSANDRLSAIEEMEKERLRIERARLILAMEVYKLQLQAHRKASRSFLERIDDALFDW